MRYEKHAVLSQITPRAPPDPQIVDINDFHRSDAHANEDLLHKTPKQLGVESRGEMRPSRGCAEEKGLRRSIPRSIHTRATEPASRMFADLTGIKPDASRGERGRGGRGRRVMIVGDGDPRYTRLYFLRSKHHAELYFTKVIAEISPRKVEMARSD